MQALLYSLAALDMTNERVRGHLRVHFYFFSQAEDFSAELNAKVLDR